MSANIEKEVVNPGEPGFDLVAWATAFAVQLEKENIKKMQKEVNELIIEAMNNPQDKEKVKKSDEIEEAYDKEVARLLPADEYARRRGTPRYDRDIEEYFDSHGRRVDIDKMRLELGEQRAVIYEFAYRKGYKDLDYYSKQKGYDVLEDMSQKGYYDGYNNALFFVENNYDLMSAMRGYLKGYMDGFIYASKLDGTDMQHKKMILEAYTKQYVAGFHQAVNKG